MVGKKRLVIVTDYFVESSSARSLCVPNTVRLRASLSPCTPSTLTLPRNRLIVYSDIYDESRKTSEGQEKVSMDIKRDGQEVDDGKETPVGAENDVK